ncbi:hypothetical protein EGJ34_09595 [Stenotrophomonas sp. 278]|nr:hypothetical protein EGJ34_09595 [Stenotrophomonas sp. 278]
MMKLPTLSVLIAGTLFSASGHASQDDNEAVGRWLSERVMRAALQEDAPVPRSFESEGTYRVISLSELDAPEEVKRHFRAEMARSRAGVKRVSAGEIPSQAEMLSSLPKTVRSNAELRGRLPSPPTNLRGTLLGAAELIGMEPSGALNGLKSTGLTRFYRLDGVGIVEFNEDNFRAPGSTIEVIAELQNTKVNQEPAQLDRVSDDQGRSRASLIWAGESKLYTLIATGEGDVQRKVDVLQQIAAAVRD